jgi:hypothetical protein
MRCDHPFDERELRNRAASSFSDYSTAGPSRTDQRAPGARRATRAWVETRVSGRFRSRGASTTTLLSLRVSVSLSRTRASDGVTRPSRCLGRSRRWRALPRRATWPPASPGRCISPGPALQPVRMRCCSSVISFRMAPRGAPWTFWAFITAGRAGNTPASRHLCFLVRWDERRCSTPVTGCVSSRCANGCCCPSMKSSGTSNEYLRGKLLPVWKLSSQLRPAG